MSPEVVTQSEVAGQWWRRYREAIESAGLSESAVRVVELDSEYILKHGVLAAGDPATLESAWPAGRLRRGLVIGSVQSGKTASMLGLMAKSLDSHVDIVVLLAGTRIALWRQTLDRALAQLDGWSPPQDGDRRLARILLPDPGLVLAGRGAPGLASLYHTHPSRVRRAISKRRPFVAIVMKQADHLMRFGSHLLEVMEVCLSHLERPLRLLVIDDEADDGSILDAVVESSMAPDSEGFKQIPRHIARLWAGQGPHHQTFHDRLYATYVGYTATPQANLLQSDHNPLSPTDFVIALRTPFEAGNVDPPRDVTYAEPEGLRRYYTGGELFYNRLSDGSDRLIRVHAFPDRNEFHSVESFETAVLEQRVELMGDALRSFFVASAIRLLRCGRQLSWVSAGPIPLEEVRAKSPPPSTMLVHPAASIDTQLKTARSIAQWSSGVDPTTSDPSEYPSDASGRAVLDPAGLTLRLKAEPELWMPWFESYEATRTRLAEYPGGAYAKGDASSEWDDVCSILIDEVFGNTRLAVVNSDPLADDRPEFDPVDQGDGRYRAAPDLLTIFVSGNVMSRGITLEGLTTTVFLREAKAPAADTQMQMQRWFGYRGPHLPFCRVFLYEDQLDLFRAYHENDMALRAEVINEMNFGGKRAPSPQVLQGARFRATGKIANLRALPLHPGPQPFVGLLDTGPFLEGNNRVLEGLLDRLPWSALTVGGNPAGLICGQQLSMLEVAEVLEALSYSQHDPDPAGPSHTRWRSLAIEFGLNLPEAPFFRPPGHGSQHPELVSPNSCPYTIAAYLRAWSAALNKPARGLYPTDNHRSPWSMINLVDYANTAPRFYAGVRFGSQGLATSGRLREHSIHRMQRKREGDVLIAKWGSRNPREVAGAYLGDHLFDYHVHGAPAPKPIPGVPPWRPRGAPGLLLFHVIRVEDTETITAGLCLPIGGPDRFAAIPPEESG